MASSGGAVRGGTRVAARLRRPRGVRSRHLTSHLTPHTSPHRPAPALARSDRARRFLGLITPLWDAARLRAGPAADTRRRPPTARSALLDSSLIHSSLEDTFLPLTLL